MRTLLVCDNPNLLTGLSIVGKKFFDFLKHRRETFHYAINSKVPYEDDNFFEDHYFQSYRNDFGEGDFERVIDAFSPELVISIGDPFHYGYIASSDKRKTFRWVLYCTIDSHNFVGSIPNSWLNVVSNADFVATPSMFGFNILQRALGKEVQYIPFGTDIDVLSKESAEAIREEAGLDDAFVVLFANRNSFRKQISSFMKVAALLRLIATGDKFDRIAFFAHTTEEPTMGYEIQNLAEEYGVDVQFSLEKVGSLSSIYALAAYGNGVHLYPSLCEGFGLTILESMRCHVPVVASDYSAMAELVGDKDLLIDPLGYVTSLEGTEEAIFDVKKGSEKVLELFNDNELASTLAESAYLKTERFSWRNSLEALNDIVDSVGSPKPLQVQENPEGEKVSLIVLDSIDFVQNTYFPVDEVIPIKSVDIGLIREAISKANNDLIAIQTVFPQRGWLSELVRLMDYKTLVVSSTIVDPKGRVFEGEFYINDEDDIYFLREGSKIDKADCEAFSFPFYSVLIDRENLLKIGFLDGDMEFRVSGMEACIRGHVGGFRSVISSRSLGLIKQHVPFDKDSMRNFKTRAKGFLEQRVEVIYEGARQKIFTEFGFLEKNVPVNISRKRAILLSSKYRNISVELPNRKAQLQQAMEKDGLIKVGRNRGFGDVIAAALFGAAPLKKANPKISLTFVTDPVYVEFVESTGLFDRVLSYPSGMTTNTGYDYVHDLTYLPETTDPESQRNRAEIFARHISGYQNWEFAAYVPPKKYLDEAERLISEFNFDPHQKIIGIQTICTSPVRVYPPDYMTSLVEILIAKGFNVLLLGYDHGWGLGYSNWKGKNLGSLVDQGNSVMLTAGAMAHCHYFIGPDSGLTHLAGFMKIPSLALFGNIFPENRLKHYPTVEALFPRGELPCIPCGDVYNPCPECSNLEALGKFSGKCMRLLTPDRVYEAFEKDVLGLKMIEEQENSEPVFYDSCPICGSGNLSEVNRIEEWDSRKLTEEAIFSKCLNCKAIFANPTFSDVVKYDENYFMSSDEKLYYENILQKDKQPDALEVVNVFRNISAAKRRKV